MMKQVLTAGLVALGLAFALAPLDAEAKRLGGGKSAGMQRSTPDKPAQTTPAQPAAPTQGAASPNTPAPAGAAAAAAPATRSWMGPIAGLAAGLGLAALFSHLGLGEGLANVVMMALLALVAFVAIRFLMRRFMGGGVQPPLATAAAAAGAARAAPPQQFVDERPGMQRTATPVAPVVTIGSALAAPAAVMTPAGFDTEGFERLAKMLFIRMQAANDSADLADLRNFTTPELFASLRLDLQERGASAQATDVVQVDARLIDFEQEADRQVVSVRYTGLVKEDAAADATPFDEVWHLVQPADGSRPWAIAGIQQAQPA